MTNVAVTQALVLSRSSNDSSRLLPWDWISCWLACWSVTCGTWVYNSWSGVASGSSLAWNSILAGDSVNCLACWSRSIWLWVPWLDHSRAHTSSWITTDYLSWWWVIDRWSWNWLGIVTGPMGWVVGSWFGVIHMSSWSVLLVAVGDSWLGMSHMSSWLVMADSWLGVGDMTSWLVVVMASSWRGVGGVADLSVWRVVSSWFGVGNMVAWCCLTDHSWWMMCDSVGNFIIVNILNTDSQDAVVGSIRSSSQLQIQLLWVWMSLKIRPVERFRLTKIVITVPATITIIGSEGNVSMLSHGSVNVSDDELLVPGYTSSSFWDCSGLVFLAIVLETNIWILFVSTTTISIIFKVSWFDSQFDITAITSDGMTLVLTGIAMVGTSVVANISRIESFKITMPVWDFFLMTCSMWGNSDSAVGLSMMVMIPWGLYMMICLMDVWGVNVMLGRMTMTSWWGWNHSFCDTTGSSCGFTITTSLDTCNSIRSTGWRIGRVWLWFFDVVSNHWFPMSRYLWLTWFDDVVFSRIAAGWRFRSWSCGWFSSWLLSVKFRWEGAVEAWCFFRSSIGASIALVERLHSANISRSERVVDAAAYIGSHWCVCVS